MAQGANYNLISPSFGATSGQTQTVITYATTPLVPSSAQSGGFISTLQHGATTVNIQLPTTVPGLTFTVSNMVSGSTIVLSPQAAADTLVFYSAQTAKSAGASIVSGLKWSSITFVCASTAYWFGINQVGTWL